MKTDTRSPPEEKVPAQDDWIEYERRKEELRKRRLPPDIYEREIKRICDDLGL